MLEQQQDSHLRRHEVTSNRIPKQLNPIVSREQIKETPPMTEPRSDRLSEKKLGKNNGKLYRNP